MDRHLRVPIALILALTASLAAVAPQALAQQLPDLEASMLVKEDLPDGFARRSEFDPDVPPIDPDTFEANDGIARRLHVWTRIGDDGPLSVFDDRTLFPTADAARTYLLDAEDVLSERDSGGMVLDPAADPIGDLHRRYVAETRRDGQPYRYTSHLFTVGSLVAKVFVGGSADSGPAADAIAAAAAARMAAAIAAVTPTPTPAPLVWPGDPAVHQQTLLTRVGPGIETCHPVAEPAVPGELGAIFCPVGDHGEVLVLRQLDSTDSLLAAFLAFRLPAEAPAGTCRTRPAVEPHVVGTATVGELACYDAPDGTRIFIWTDERHAVLSWIASTVDRPFEALYDLHRSTLREP